MEHMVPEKGRLAPEGRPFIIGGVVVTLLAAFFTPLWVTVICALLALFVTWFFRDPARRIPGAHGLLVSPADGRVVEVTPEISDADLPRDGYTRVAIFLSVFNVHVNRAPVGGTVESVDYTAGRFLSAFRSEASTENEQNRIGLRSGEDQSRDLIPFTQIAGLIARRIVCYKKPGDVVARGERVGLIRFGSRTEILIPPGYQVGVARGDKVRGGSSIIASLRPTTD
jgi:phosphatidylserine decarboxylase